MNNKYRITACLFIIELVVNTFTLAKDNEITEVTNTPSDSIWAIHKSQIFFEENQGQFQDSILFQSSVFGSQIRFCAKGISYAMIRETSTTEHHDEPEKYRRKIGLFGEVNVEHEALVWNTMFKGANDHVRPEAVGNRPENIHYFKGNQSSDWNKNVKRFKQLNYPNLYPNIDLRYYGTENQELKYDFILRPGAEVKSIQLTYEGIDSLEIDANNQLIIHTQWGIFTDAAPYSYQDVYQYREEIDVEYTLIDKQTLGFEIKSYYDPSIPLIIDPVILNWSSFVHSSTSDDYLMALKEDDEGNIYLTGYTKSYNFPVTPGVYQNVYGGGLDLYVAKLSPNGKQLKYASYLGGSDWELGYGIEINSKGDIIIGGFTRSEDFPTTLSANYQNQSNGFIDIFILCLAPGGDELIFSTYLGGSDRDYLYDMQLGPNDELFFTGFTLSTDFPVTDNAFQPNSGTNGDTYLCKLNPEGNDIIYATYYGGSGYEIGQDIFVNEQGAAYIVGNTNSNDFPTVGNVIQQDFLYEEGKIAEEGFLIKFDHLEGEPEFASFLGGTSGDGIYGIDVDAKGHMYVTGVTYSVDFPTTPGSLMSDGLDPRLGDGDTFVAKLDATASNILYSTYLGGNDIDFSKSIKVDLDGFVHILGASRSDNFPVTTSQSVHTSMYDVFLAKLDPNGKELIASTMLGGENNEYPRAAGSLYLGKEYITLGITSHSTQVPMEGDTYQATKMNGNNDAPLVVQLFIDQVLPLEWSAWEANWDRDSNHVNINWNLSQETTGPFIEVQRKVDDEKWESIAFLQLEKRLDFPTGYTDREARRFEGRNLLYRIAFVAEGGLFQHSSIKMVQIPKLNLDPLVITPNPVKNLISLQYQPSSPTRHTFSIYQSDGKLLSKKEVFPTVDEMNSTSVFAWDLSDFSPGIYFIELDNHKSAPNHATFIKQ